MAMGVDWVRHAREVVARIGMVLSGTSHAYNHEVQPSFFDVLIGHGHDIEEVGPIISISIEIEDGRLAKIEPHGHLVCIPAWFGEVDGMIWGTIDTHETNVIGTVEG